MKYAIRAFKSFIYFTVLFTIILFVLAKLRLVEDDINSLFRDGVDSVWKILVFFAVISALYPRFKYCSRTVAVEGGMVQNSGAIIHFFDSKGYILTVNDEEKMVFRLKGVAGRLSRMFEDAITVTTELPGIQLEGMSKDVLRLNYGLQGIFEKKEEE